MKQVKILGSVLLMLVLLFTADTADAQRCGPRRHRMQQGQTVIVRPNGQVIVKQGNGRRGQFRKHAHRMGRRNNMPRVY
jgi:hypothetical protein